MIFTINLKSIKQFIRPYLLLTLLVSGNSIAQDISPGAQQPAQEIAPIEAPSDRPVYELPSPDKRDKALDDEQIIEIGKVNFFYNSDKKNTNAEESIVNKHREKAVDLAEQFLRAKENQLTFEDLELLAQTITLYFREQGYLLSRVVLPPQKIKDNKLRLDVYEGVIEDIAVEKNSFYAAKQLSNAILSEKGKVVKEKNIVSHMLRINDMPGQQAVALFKPGKNVGTTLLTVKSVEEKPLAFRARVDNYGNESTGELRLLLGSTVNNITGNIDKLSVDFIQTFDKGDLKNARINYEITHPDLIHTFGLFYSETRYDIERFAPDGARGDTEIAEAYLHSSWLRGQFRNFSTHVGLSTKRAESIDTGFDGIDRLTVASLYANWDNVDRRFRGVQQFTLGLHQGIDDFIGSMDTTGNQNSLGRVPPGVQELSGRFEKISANYSRLQYISRNHNLLLRLAGQYTDDIISSLEKMSLGGGYSVRAYPVGEYVAETASFASLEWIINAGLISDAVVFNEYTLGELLEFSVFTDYGWGKNRNFDNSITRRELKGSGVGMQFSLPDNEFYIRLSAAKPLGNETAINGDDEQYWFAIGANF